MPDLNFPANFMTAVLVIGMILPLGSLLAQATNMNQK